MFSKFLISLFFHSRLSSKLRPIFSMAHCAFCFIVFIFCIQSVKSFGQVFPVIENLSSRDSAYQNLVEAVDYHRELWEELEEKFSIEKMQKMSPLKIFMYTVKKEDNLFDLASKFHLQVDTLISYNILTNEEDIQEGKTLLIPNMDGIVIFPKNQTPLATLEELYHIPLVLLQYVNQIQTLSILPQEELFIPFTRLSSEEKSYFLFEPFIYPVKDVVISSHFGKRYHPVKKRWLYHTGIDIAVPMKTPVYPTTSGKVISIKSTKESGGYGNLVVLEHKYGYTSWYGHLSKILVQVGDEVMPDQIIAESGNTGISSGPHLHFEIRRNNNRLNPTDVLSFQHP